MGRINQLNTGLVCGDSIYDEVVKEILSHQGILFKEIRKRSDDYEKFPCVILSRYIDEDYKLAGEHVETEDSIVIAEKEIPLNVVLNALGGNLESPSTDLIHPLVNQHENEFLMKIREKHHELGLPLVRKWFWPSFFEACCVMTHDVDWLYYSPWHFAVMRNKSIFQFVKLAYQSLIHKRNYGNNILEIIRKEKQRNLRSSFFFLIRHLEYEEELSRILKLLKDENFEIGLHGSFSSHKNVDFLKGEKTRLEKYVNVKTVGVRQHELKFLVPFTWRYQEEAGFAYDLTFSYNDKLGFRGGTCFPYHPIDIIQNRKFSLLEIPTSFMDWTALSKSYKELQEIVMKLSEIVEKFHGCLLMNLHNTYQNRETFPIMEKFYSHILDYVKERNYWVATAGECCLWWLRREEAKVDMAIKDDWIKGKTSTYPLPLIVEKMNGERMHINLQEAEFKIDINKPH